MKRIPIILLCISMLPMLAHPQSLDTKGDYSPTIVAKSFTATYGVRADAVQAILEVYARQGLTPQERKARAETLIQDYQNAVSHPKGVSQLTEADQQKLGIATESGLVRALNWDMFARQYYLSTAGSNSPAIVAAGDVAIWYGIPEPALRTLAGRLEANAVELGEFGTQLKELAEKYEALKKEFEIYGPGDPVVRQAEKLLDEGKLEEAEALLESDYRVSKKRLAYKAYLFGKTKELLLKYEEAAEGLRDAMALDSENLDYLIAYGNLESALAHYDLALSIFDKGLTDPNISKKLTKKQESDLLNDIGFTLGKKGDNDKAISFFELCLKIDTATLGAYHPDIATSYNNLGAAFLLKGEIEKAMMYFEKAIVIDSIALDSFGLIRDLANLGTSCSSMGSYVKAIEHLERARRIDSIFQPAPSPFLAQILDNLGTAWSFLGENDKALEYYEKALAISINTFGNFHPQVAIRYNNLGLAFKAIGEYEKALSYLRKALAIDSIVLGRTHYEVAANLNNIGTILSSMGEYDKAIQYYEEALEIDSIVYQGINPNVGIHLNNLGKVWMAKGEYDKSITFFTNSLSILLRFHPVSHPFPKKVYGNLASALTGRAIELLQQSNPSKALPYFQNARLNWALANRPDMVLESLLNIGTTHMHLQNFRQALQVLDHVQFLADSTIAEFQKLGKDAPDSVKNTSRYLATCDSVQLATLPRTIRLHRIQCLQALGFHKEAKAAVKTLITDALAAKDEFVIADLRKDGWLKE